VPLLVNANKGGDMKKAFVMIGVLAVVAFVIFAASNGFAFKIPTSVSDVTKGPQNAAYDACKVWADQHKNNMAYNSTNIEKEMKGKDFSNLIYEKDYRKGGSKYDKQNKKLDLRATYNEFAEIKVRCTKDECSSIYCSKK